jgi:hypothetical protein
MNLKKIWLHVLARKVPHAVLSWRYLLPNQSEAVRRHRRVFLSAWPRYPRAVWLMVALYSFTLWYLWYGWAALYRTIRYVKPRYSASAPANSMTRYLQLCWLTFAHTTPPGVYYFYQLYRFPERAWLNFIYTHELPHWHHYHSPHITTGESALLSDKHNFAETMRSADLPAIESILQLSRGERLLPETMFQQRSLFIKPLCGSRKEGCYELRYCRQDNSYLLLGEIDSSDPSTIIDQVQRELDKQAMIVQPLLQNHSLIAPACKDNLLATIRVVTALQEGGVALVCAILEIPLSAQDKTVFPLPICLSSGEVLPARLLGNTPENEADFEHIEQSSLIGTTLPHWDKVLATVIAAHDFLPNVATVGWDCAVTTDGVRLIEGNFNWGVAPHQLGGIPLLTQRAMMQ